LILKKKKNSIQMHKIIKFPQGIASTTDANGRKINVATLYGYIPEDCESDLTCYPPVIRFVDSNGVNREIPLEQLFNYLTDQGVIDTLAPAAPTAIVFSAILSTGFQVDWTAGTDINLLSHIVYQDGVEIAEVTAGTDFFVVPSLIASTSYAMTVKAKDVGGNLSTALAGAEVTVPTVPNTILFSSVAATSFQVDWTEGIPNPAIVSHKVYLDTVLNDTVTAGTDFKIITGLTTATSYDVDITAVDSFGGESILLSGTQVTA
jgi:hypothetical protein